MPVLFEVDIRHCTRWYFEPAGKDRVFPSGPGALSSRVEIIGGKVKFGKELDVELIGGDASDVFVESASKFVLGKESRWEGTILARDRLKLGGPSRLGGAAYSATKLIVGKEVQIDFVPSSRILAILDPVTPP